MKSAAANAGVRGKTIRFQWTDGPTKGSTHEHVFHEDGSVDYHKVGAGDGEGKPTHEKQYAAERISDDVYLVSYLGSSGYTLTTALNFADGSLTGFASGAKEWYPVKGRFEVVG